ncbi:NADH-quinone oxidoreductase subunit 15 [Oceanithermus sp.]|uniref:NADH-quinone oxidoreductase n=2 Tax=Oceanithermus TaxID=208447 RepID=A0A7C4VDZ2_9DEIN|nr:NADH-quinone oxidoreductase subunit 15 [Oceanithermus sp.]HGY09923.1 NADH-quinone oxidoreductase [Oceanithermus profundus]
MSHAIYDAWVQLMGWLEEYAAEHDLVFDREADFPEFIYRMHKPWELPTRVMTVSLSRANDEPFFVASVSQPSDERKHIGLRSPGAHLHWHAHEHGGGLELSGGVKLDKAKLFALLDQARRDWMTAV